MDKNNLKFFSTGILALLVVVFAMYFVFAGSFDATSSTTSVNEDVSNFYNITIINTNVTVNTTITYVNITMPSGFTFTSGTNGSSVSGITFSNTSNVLTWNKTTLVLNGTTQYFWFNATAITPGTFNFSVTTLDNASISVTNTTNNSVTVNDTTAPAPTSLILSSATKTSLTLTFSGAEGTCTVDRGGATVSGSIVTESGLYCGETYTYVLTCTDGVGNAGVISATSFLTNNCGRKIASAGTTESIDVKESTTISKITPGVAQIVKNFEFEVGIKEIKIEVNNEVQNVKVTVIKYSGRPAEVSVSKSGKVYQYLEIGVENLGVNLDKAIVTIRVEKSWISDNGVGMDNVVISKFDEDSSVWNELSTTPSGEDNTYYFYDAEVDSFSFFAISAKAVAEEPVVTVTGGRSLTGWVAFLVLAVLAIVAWVWYNKNYTKGKK